MSDLKTKIKQSNELGDDYVETIDKYVELNVYLNSLNNVTRYAVSKKNDSDIFYNVVLYDNNKVLERRKEILKDNKIYIAKRVRHRTCFLHGLYFRFSLFQ